MHHRLAQAYAARASTCSTRARMVAHAACSLQDGTLTIRELPFLWQVLRVAEALGLRGGYRGQSWDE